MKRTLKAAAIFIAFALGQLALLIVFFGVPYGGAIIGGIALLALVAWFSWLAADGFRGDYF